MKWNFFHRVTTPALTKKNETRESMLAAYFIISLSRSLSKQKLKEYVKKKRVNFVFCNFNSFAGSFSVNMTFLFVSSYISYIIFFVFFFSFSFYCRCKIPNTEYVSHNTTENEYNKLWKNGTKRNEKNHSDAVFMAYVLVCIRYAVVFDRYKTICSFVHNV